MSAGAGGSDRPRPDATSGSPRGGEGPTGRRDAPDRSSAVETGEGRVLPERAAEDLDRGWGDRPGSEEDDRLLGERPPHWER